MPRELTPAEQAELDWTEGQMPAPAVALTYAGGGFVEGVPRRDLTAADTARYLTKSAYRAALDAGYYTRPAAPAADPPPPPAAEQEPS